MKGAPFVHLDHHFSGENRKLPCLPDNMIAGRQTDGISYRTIKLVIHRKTQLIMFDTELLQLTAHGKVGRTASHHGFATVGGNFNKGCTMRLNITQVKGLPGSDCIYRHTAEKF